MIYDAIIFGGGVVGASIFSKLTRIGKNAILVEKENDVALGASKANSGICHAGYDCEENSLKARLNVRGGAIMPKICEELSVPFKKCGSYVVGNDLEKLVNLYNRGINNGVKNLKIIKENLTDYIPNLKSNFKYALYAENAGIVNPYMLTIAYAEDAVINGGKIHFNYSTTSIKKENDYFIISNGKTEIKASIIINACGKGYNDIATLIGSETYPLTFRRGEYFLIDRDTNFVSSPIFPLPTEKGKGILATPTTDGNILLGPTADDGEYSTKTTAQGLNEIKQQIINEFDNIPFNKVIRVFSGVRVSSGKDFIIEKSKKIENIINIAGINSPGLTSAPAIAEYVCNLLNFSLEEKENLKRRKDYKIPATQRNEYIKQNSKYGKIICRCEVVSEGEIIDAIHSPLSPRSIDGIKRRVRCGMGRCQGSFCTNKICHIIAEQTGLKAEEIIKDKNGSNLMVGDIKETQYFKDNVKDERSTKWNMIMML